MVTRAFAAQNIRETTREIGAFRSTVTGTILPVLGLSAAMGFLSGGFNDATASGRIASTASYGLQIAMYGLQDAITRALLPAIEAITPRLVDAVNWFVDLNEQTEGWALNIAAAAGAAYFARGPIAALYRLGRFGLGAVGTGAGALAGTAGVGAAGTAGLVLGGAAAGAGAAVGLGYAASLIPENAPGQIGALGQGARVITQGRPDYSNPANLPQLDTSQFGLAPGVTNSPLGIPQASPGFVQSPYSTYNPLLTENVFDLSNRGNQQPYVFPQYQQGFGFQPQGFSQNGFGNQFQPQPIQETRTVIINAPGVYDTDGFIRRLQETIDNGSVRLD